MGPRPIRVQLSWSSARLGKSVLITTVLRLVAVSSTHRQTDCGKPARKQLLRLTYSRDLTSCNFSKLETYIGRSVLRLTHSRTPGAESKLWSVGARALGSTAGRESFPGTSTDADGALAQLCSGRRGDDHGMLQSLEAARLLAFREEACHKTPGEPSIVCNSTKPPDLCLLVAALLQNRHQ